MLLRECPFLFINIFSLYGIVLKHTRTNDNTKEIYHREFLCKYLVTLHIINVTRILLSRQSKMSKNIIPNHSQQYKGCSRKFGPCINCMTTLINQFLIIIILLLPYNRVSIQQLDTSVTPTLQTLCMQRQTQVAITLQLDLNL